VEPAEAGRAGLIAAHPAAAFLAAAYPDERERSGEEPGQGPDEREPDIVGG